LEDTKTHVNVRAQKEFGGSAGSTNEEPVSSVDTRRPPDNAPEEQDGLAEDAIVREPAPPLQAPKASGRDHPVETEHDLAHQKLHGESERRLKNADNAPDSTED